MAATALALLARRIGIPYPILLVLGGLALGFVPGLPPIQLEPEIVFLLFLPPILFGAGYFTSLRDFKRNLRAITLLSVGLVVFTTVAVAVAAAALVPGMGWAAAFALGAIVAPPDAVAATTVFQRLGVPRRVVTILEGESLVNDATALVAYRFAIIAASTGTFSIANAGLTFVAVAVGGVAFGLLMGLILAWALRRIDDPVFSVVLTLLAPVATYLPAEQFHLSGVLATVAAGIWVGRNAPREMSSSVRLAGTAAWQVLLFLINGTVFILIGAQLRSVAPGPRRVHARAADRAGRRDLRGRDRRPDPVGLPGHLRPAGAQRRDPRRASRTRRHGTCSSCRGPGCAASCRSLRRWHCRCTSPTA